MKWFTKNLYVNLLVVFIAVIMIVLAFIFSNSTAISTFAGTSLGSVLSYFIANWQMHKQIDIERWSREHSEKEDYLIRIRKNAVRIKETIRKTDNWLDGMPTTFNKTRNEKILFFEIPDEMGSYVTNYLKELKNLNDSIDEYAWNAVTVIFVHKPKYNNDINKAFQDILEQKTKISKEIRNIALVHSRINDSGKFNQNEYNDNLKSIKKHFKFIDDKATSIMEDIKLIK